MGSGLKKKRPISLFFIPVIEQVVLAMGQVVCMQRAARQTRQTREWMSNINYQSITALNRLLIVLYKFVNPLVKKYAAHTLNQLII